MERTARQAPNNPEAVTSPTACGFFRRPPASMPAITAPLSRAPPRPPTPERTARSVSTAPTAAAARTRPSAGRSTPRPSPLGGVFDPAGTSDHLTAGPPGARRPSGNPTAGRPRPGSRPRAGRRSIGRWPGRAGAAVTRRTGRIGPVEALEHPRRLLLADAGTLVADLDGDRATRPGRVEGDRAPGRRVPRRVVEQVGQHRVNPRRVTVGGGARRIHRDGHLHPGAPQARLPGRVLQHGPQVEGPSYQRHRPRLQAGQIEQLRGQGPEPLHLPEHGPQRLRIGGFHTVDQVLEHRPEGADGRPQLVRDVGNEIPAHPVDLGQLGRHGVEGPASSPTSSWDVAVTRRP